MGPNTPKKVSLIFEAIERINKKLGHLREELKPIISDNPEVASDKLSEATDLARGLSEIEDKVSFLLDHIVI